MGLRFSLGLSAFLPTLLSAWDYFSVATGCFDLLRDKHRSWEFSMEYKFLCSKIPKPNAHVDIRPLVGVMSTVQGSGYLYTGVNFDIHLGSSVVFAPGFAAGYYWVGKGKNLGYPLEFRSGVELSWLMKSGYRLGAHFYHLSNASIGKRNPGEESLVLFYDIPITNKFPFPD